MKKRIAFRYIRQFLLGQQAQTAIILLVGLLANLITLFIPILLAQTLELSYARSSVKSSFWQALGLDHALDLSAIVTIMIILMLGKFLLDYGFRMLSAKMGELHTKVLRERLFHHQLLMEFEHYKEKGAGRFLLRYGGDLTSIRNYLTLGVLRFGSDLMLVTIAVGILTVLDVRLGLVFLTVLGLFMGLVLVLNRFLHDQAQYHRDRKSGLLSFVQKRFELLTTIKAFNRIGKEQQRFEKRSGKVYQAAMDYHQWNSLIRAMIPFLSYGLIVFLLLFSLSGDVGHLSVSMLLILTIQPVLRRLFLVGSTWEKGKISYSKLDRVFQYAIENYKTEEDEQPEWPLTIEWAGKQAEKWDTIKVDAGDWVFLGADQPIDTNGLPFNLLGLEQNVQWQISFGDQDLGQIDRFLLRKQVAGLSSAFPLLGDSVFTAVSYNQKERNKLKAQRMLDLLQDGLPKKEKLCLQDPIGYKGSKLSKAQVQLLSWIRLLMTGKAIWIVEDPFLHLPEGIKKNLITELEKKKGRQTIIWLTSPEKYEAVKHDHLTAPEKIKSFTDRKKQSGT